MAAKIRRSFPSFPFESPEPLLKRPFRYRAPEQRLEDLFLQNHCITSTSESVVELSLSANDESFMVLDSYEELVETFLPSDDVVDEILLDNVSVSDEMGQDEEETEDKNLTIIENNNQTRPLEFSRTSEVREDVDESFKIFKNKMAPRVASKNPSRQNETRCIVCQNSHPLNMIKCAGACKNYFHSTCLNLDAKMDPKIRKCATCLTGEHRCNICLSTNGGKIGCSVPACGKFYHQTCLESGLWPQTKISQDFLVCPDHVCHTCGSKSPSHAMPKYALPLLHCVRCPTAYHPGNFCLPAGFVRLNGCQLICSKHFNSSTSNNESCKHVNASWCFSCLTGGQLIGCELCPASFHSNCLQTSSSRGSFYCSSCKSGRLPLYGQVVWVKHRLFDWWPAKVIHLQKDLPVGIFQVQVCGTKELVKTFRGRCFPFKEEHLKKISDWNKLQISVPENIFQFGLDEAAEIHKAFNRRKSLIAPGTKPQLKPQTFIRIKNNKPFGDCPVFSSSPLDHQKCECEPNAVDPCGKSSDCINRYIMVECSPRTCPAGDSCRNMQFQRRNYPKLKVSHASKKGWGLYVLEDVKKGDFIIEYVGELITMPEFTKRMSAMLSHSDGEQNYYFMVMDNNRVIDAGPKGNVARFINHSCSPNCETQKWTVNGDTRIGIFALEDISAGSELTFNYQLEDFGDVKKPCLCGSENCSGFIGEKPNRSKKTKQWDDHCFGCYQDGEVILCDFKSCPRVYHMKCVGLDQIPRGNWFCPRHFCLVCGEPSLHHCSHCPNAYCTDHMSALSTHPVLKIICDAHSGDLGDMMKFYNALLGKKDDSAKMTEPTFQGPDLNKNHEISTKLMTYSPVVTTPLPKKNLTENVTTPISLTRTSERLIKCPGCDANLRASVIKRHIRAKHYKLMADVLEDENESISGILSKFQLLSRKRHSL